MFIVNPVSYPDCVVCGLLRPHASPGSIRVMSHTTPNIKKFKRNSILYLQRSMTTSYDGQPAKGFNLSF